MFERGESEGVRIINEWETGMSWMAHPEEKAERVSHAIRTADGVWIFDPLNAPNIDQLISDLGKVAGVAVLSCWHSRDADLFAEKYGSSVYLPEWMGRVQQRVNAPIKRYAEFPCSDLCAIPSRPYSFWDEVFLYQETSETLFIPDSLGTIGSFLVGQEVLGLQLLRRLRSPHQLSDLDPDRILVGHGEGVMENSGAVLEEALREPRKQFPRALVRNGPATLRNIIKTLG
ncbi:hypothetical protein [Natronorubrum thiooxidans]|uniref:Metallo-beta-lactamase superfamily protein n=1 Tax=Natronorubrum thiooxidans TaxID=308853 RepID=A0A1N7H8R7_9EURY|nr:hypothetical protein [Natronorubrum thiooxidans]SIS21257.1 hypothetical protein SAMN05421752_1342 [Natronorubrum thiooxidans]